ncbi:MAG: FAD-binding oxidoreductase [Rubellimicrobium sp.]|nr:FAD-binding oxidoreductase [Rubellimicrobium sp.]
MALATTPAHATYDVVIAGGAMMGSSLAFWLSRNPDFRGRILVVERDPTHAQAATSLSNSSIRQQFGQPVNVQISRFAAEFIRHFADYMEDDSAPAVTLHSFGYLYLAADEGFAASLGRDARMQNSLGTPTRILTPDEIAAQYPFYALDDILLGSINTMDEGFFDGATIFDWFRRKARARGVEYVTDEVTALDRAGGRITGVRLASGARVAPGVFVDAAGTRGAQVAAMAGLSLPVEARRRYTWVFDSPPARAFGQPVPLTIDPTGVHVRSDGHYFLAGCKPQGADPAVDPDDFAMDHSLWEEWVWPVIASRIPAFETARVINAWAGHYDFNTLDQNAILGPHPEVGNFLFCNGFSGHGLQQGPAVGRGLAELVMHGRYATLDLSALGYDRIAAGRPLTEGAII